MRWINAIVVAVLVAAILIFAVQNFQITTVSFLNFRISAPLALLVALVYLLGMITGGSVWALVRWAMEGTRQLT
jgi:lipopolysaccharide assembly protein A